MNRELSWLATSMTGSLPRRTIRYHPLLERLPLPSISASNLDEFYMGAWPVSKGKCWRG